MIFRITAIVLPVVICVLSWSLHYRCRYHFTLLLSLAYTVELVGAAVEVILAVAGAASGQPVPYAIVHLRKVALYLEPFLIILALIAALRKYPKYKGRDRTECPGT